MLCRETKRANAVFSSFTTISGIATDGLCGIDFVKRSFPHRKVECVALEVTEQLSPRSFPHCETEIRFCDACGK